VGRLVGSSDIRVEPTIVNAPCTSLFIDVCVCVVCVCQSRYHRLVHRMRHGDMVQNAGERERDSRN
jgi:hypothetical protein